MPYILSSLTCIKNLGWCTITFKIYTITIGSAEWNFSKNFINQLGHFIIFTTQQGTKMQYVSTRTD